MADTPDLKNFKYIVFLIDAKHKDHDGKVFSLLSDARKFVREYQEEKWATKFVIGTFLYEPDVPDMNIRLIETFGFKDDKKHVEQLRLF